MEIKKDKYSTNGIGVLFSNKRKTIIDGTIPKEIISAKESNSFPNRFSIFINLEKKPSKKSKIIENKVEIAESLKFFDCKNIIDMHPQNKFNKVNILGIIFFVIKMYIICKKNYSKIENIIL